MIRLVRAGGTIRFAWHSRVLAVLFSAWSVLGWSDVQAAGVTVAVSCGATGAEFDQCRTGAEAWAKETGNQVKLVSAPNSTTERLALYQQLLAAGSSDIDVMAVDVIWPGIIGDHFLDLTPHLTADELKAHFPAFIENNKVGGKVVALPWFVDAGLLYYRKDLLEKYGEKVPQTWTDLVKTAKKIQDAERKAGNSLMWGYVFQGRAYEGLTCNALEWIHSHSGGTIIDEKGNVTVNNPKAVAAIDQAASWIEQISPKGVLNYTEEESRGMFQSGNAVFLRNWPYVWSLANGKGSLVRGKIGVTTLPKGADGSRTGTLGGWSVAISKYTKNKEAAVSLAKYLTGAKEQKRRALTGGFNPSLVGLYKDKDILAKHPHLSALQETFSSAVPRPARITGAKYNRVSSEFWEAVHQTLSGKGDAKSNLSQLERKLKRIGRNGKW